ncbi:hypothetical protein EMIT0P265_270012 [Pseudomonas zeae]
MPYHELSVEERVTIQLGHVQGFSLRRIALMIKRSPSTISRELRRNGESCGSYSAHCSALYAGSSSLATETHAVAGQ